MKLKAKVRYAWSLQVPRRPFFMNLWQKYRLCELCKEAEGSIFTSQKRRQLEGGRTRSKSCPGEPRRAWSTAAASSPAWLFKTPPAASCQRRRPPPAWLLTSPSSFQVSVFWPGVPGLHLDVALKHLGTR